MSVQTVAPTFEHVDAAGHLSAWWCAALGLAFALVVPFFVVDVPPVLDYPNHLARYVVLANPNDALLSQMYEIRWAVLPNLGIDVIAVGLLKIFDVHVAGRIVLVLCLLTPLIGVIAYSRVVFGTFTWWSLASGLVAFNGIFILGFLNFQASVGLAFLAAAVWIALREQGRDVAAALAGAANAAVLFFFHIFGVGLFALLIGTHELARLYRCHRAGSFSAIDVVRTCVLGAVTLAPALMLFAMSPLADSGGIGVWGGSQKIWYLLTPFMSYSKTLTLLTVLILFSLWVLVLRNRRLAVGALPALVALAIAFVAAPTAIGQGTFVDDRIALMIGLMLFAGVRPRVSQRAGVIAGVVIAGLIGVRVGATATVWAEHRADLADLRTAMAKIEPGSRVLAMRGSELNSPEDSIASRTLPGVATLYLHVPALLLIERRAFWPFLFADPSQQPVVVKPPYDRLAHPLSEPMPVSWLSRDLPSKVTQTLARYLPAWRERFDEVIVVGADAAPQLPSGLIQRHSGSFVRLYRIAR